jgi:hypothetical protein
MKQGNELNESKIKYETLAIKWQQWRELALDMQDAIVSIEAHTMDDNASIFKNRIKLLEVKR